MPPRRLLPAAAVVVVATAAVYVLIAPVPERLSLVRDAQSALLYVANWNFLAQSGDYFAADAWAASKAFFDSVKALPGPISRDALLAQLRGTGTYDADGFFGPIQLGKKLSNGCYVLMQVVDAKWKRITPDRGFIC